MGEIGAFRYGSLISSIRLDLLEVLGDDYISQHIYQSYREYAEQTSYKMYMSDMLKHIATAFTGAEIERRWIDILSELDGSATQGEQTETEQEVKSRLLAKLNGREGE